MKNKNIDPGARNNHRIRRTAFAIGLLAGAGIGAAAHIEGSENSRPNPKSQETTVTTDIPTTTTFDMEKPQYIPHTSSTQPLYPPESEQTPTTLDHPGRSIVPSNPDGQDSPRDPHVITA